MPSDDEDDRFPDRKSYSRTKAPTFDGRAENWKTYFFQLKAFTRKRSKQATQILSNAKEPKDDVEGFRDRFAEEIGGWASLEALASPADIRRYSSMKTK